MRIITFFLLLIFPVLIHAQSIIINEVMASNSGGDTLEDGSSPDWIELLNTGDENINLKGYVLHDYDAQEQYIFGDTILRAGAMIVVYATGAPIMRINGLSSASFKIGAGSDAIFLLNDKQELIDQIHIKDVPANISIGRKPNDAGTEYWLYPTTLGAPNTSEAFSTERLSMPTFSQTPGIYPSAQKIGLNNKNSGATIYYTTDGSAPSPEKGILYQDSIEVNTSAPIRAAAFKSNCWPSATATGTFLILKRTISLPIVSLAVDPYNFFDPQIGMYMLGPDAEPESPFFGANFWKETELPAHFELFETDGTRAVNSDAGVKIAGDHSRANSQKSLSIIMRSKYGNEKIKYRVFEDKPIDEFDKLLLRNSGGDFTKSQMRDGFMSVLVKDLEFDRMAYRPAVLFINGTYWGIQNIRERISNDYIAENHGVDPDSVDLLEKHNKVKEGSNKDYIALLHYLMDNPVSQTEHYQYVASQMDMQSFIDYMNTELYIVNVDWPGNNVRYWKSPGRPWRWIFYDGDLGFDNCFDYCVYGSTQSVSQMMLPYATQEGLKDWPNPDWSTYMLRTLLSNTEFKQQFVNSMADRLNTTFLPSSVLPIIDSLQSVIHTEIFYHSQRWNTSYDRWVQEIQKMRDFANNRPQYVWEDFVNFFGYSGLYELKLNVSAAEAGSIKLNSIHIHSFPWTGNYFQNVPISLTAVPKPGYTFVRWEGATTSSQATININANTASTLTAVFEKDQSGIPSITINEIMYNNSGNSGDWIELYNEGSLPVDIGGWIIENEKRYTAFEIPAGTTIHSSEYLCVSADTIRFRTAYNFTSIGNLGFEFSEDRDIVSLRDRHGNLIDAVKYTDRSPWPSKADGAGYSLELQPASEAGIPQNWKAATIGGTPKARNTTVPPMGPRTIVITEICYNDSKQSKSGDWFELYNFGDLTVDLSGWLIEDAGHNKMIIPQGTEILPDKYLVMANSLIDFQYVHPQIKNVMSCSIKLSSDTETILVYDRTDTLVDSVSFASSPPWPVLANGQGYTLTLADEYADNSQAQHWTIGKISGTPGEENNVSGVPYYSAIGSGDISIYPNPVVGKLWVYAPHGTAIQIADAVGRVLILASVTSDMHSEIDLATLPKGLYYISFQNEAKTGTLIISK